MNAIIAFAFDFVSAALAEGLAGFLFEGPVDAFGQYLIEKILGSEPTAEFIGFLRGDFDPK